MHSDNVGVVARSILNAVRAQVVDLRALTIGLAGIIIVIWTFDVLAQVSTFARSCCGYGLYSFLEPGGSGFFSPLLTTGLILSTSGIWRGRSTESRALQDEWNDLTSNSEVVLSVHFVERVGAWREAIRRNIEASLLNGVLLSLAIFWLALSAGFGVGRWSPATPWTFVLGLTVGCATFACLQIGAVLQSARATRREMDRQRIRVLDRVGSAGEPAPVHEAGFASEPGATAEDENQLELAEQALFGREHAAQRTARAESRIGALVVLVSGLFLTSLALASILPTLAPTQPSYLPGALWGDEVGFVLALVGLSVVAWALAGLARLSIKSAKLEGEVSSDPGATSTLLRIDQSVEQLDRARAAARRSRNVTILAGALIVARFWFFPSGLYADRTGTTPVGLMLANLAWPVALSVILWAAYRLDRIDGLQNELRQWLRALGRLEQAFWERY